MIGKFRESKPPKFLTPWDKCFCLLVGASVLVQCILVYVTANSILECKWPPWRAKWEDSETYTVISIMYLYDRNACLPENFSAPVRIFKGKAAGNDTGGLRIKPYKYAEPLQGTKLNTRMAASTRMYADLTIKMHTVWMMITNIFLVMVITNCNYVMLSMTMNIFSCTLILISIYDLMFFLSHLTHVQQFSTKGNIIQYSGWLVKANTDNYGDSSGLIILLSGLWWVRGIVFFAANILGVKVIKYVKNSLKRRQYDPLMDLLEKEQLPERKRDTKMEQGIIYYAPNDPTPYRIKRPEER